LANKADTSYFEFCLGAWVVFIQTALKNDVLNDPKKEALQEVASDNLKELTDAYLKIANAQQFTFYSNGIDSSLAQFLKA